MRQRYWIIQIELNTSRYDQFLNGFPVHGAIQFAWFAPSRRNHYRIGTRAWKTVKKRPPTILKTLRIFTLYRAYSDQIKMVWRLRFNIWLQYKRYVWLSNVVWNKRYKNNLGKKRWQQHSIFGTRETSSITIIIIS